MTDRPDSEAFIQWFLNHNGTMDREAMGIADFPAAEGGRGAVALKDLPEGHVLFTIPRALTLSTRTSRLPELFGLEEWKRLKLHQGWAGLMLCMMWEAAQGKESRWAGYLDILPAAFDTPMFWNEEDLSELAGTSIVGKLGKEDAERDYDSKIKPAIAKRPELFAQGEVYYSLERYHTMGSRILSRSFTVEKRDGEEEEEDGANADNAKHAESENDSMDVDETPSKANDLEQEENEDEDEDNDEGEDDASDIAMVPMADMLNARFGTENAKLFHEKEVLKMTTTKPIRKGEQIWNTYGDLPNAELLRRYGHVDLLKLPDGREGNPGDVVELGADIVVDVVKETNGRSTSDALAERIDWWLEEGGDDVFEFDWDLDLPPAALSLVRLLLLPDNDWKKAQSKGKPPKPKADSDILLVLEKAIEKRQAQYPTAIQDDETRLQGELSLNARHATVVRLGEKRILQAVLNKIRSALEKDKAQGSAAKRKAKAQDDGKKRSKR
ncbi:hypothetical protein CC1G_03233 [Coprinopsis cinerea okayama7|uniref:Ribosomal lysine N-methyltransferase 4 n=1 Tax=Coprinopsis cinerea (strain Okayama-7 / 130 / ATCC MYA-4618 / FGSC 9003) TaxID=240176 RepID=A8N790_COPC7|nr:hypothetical protein CC1G_03233 [Coprinopsis cinerea okayama7\|eukprot:XP_001830696.1 hypothetical protein CC1G_03233 [Coprinopsis cinerea okayama7\